MNAFDIPIYGITILHPVLFKDEKETTEISQQRIETGAL